MPHGVLYRGNAEESIRKEVLKLRYIKGIVSLPANLFYGTGIPACLVFIDKENADTREGIFFIDASNGYKKDGNKNRLREQDIEKIVRVYSAQTEIKGYSRFVKYSEILVDNDGDMNVPRYIQRIDNSLPQNIAAHLQGGIPVHDIETLDKLWSVSAELKNAIFTCVDPEHQIYKLAIPSDAIEPLFEQDAKLQAEKHLEGTEVFEIWRDEVRELLLGITENTLLQAICRTNRVYDQEKTYGLIVDYIGIFDDVAKALYFDSESVEKVISNIESVKGKVPELVEACIAFFPGVDRTRDDWEGLLAAQECLPDNETKDAFGAAYRALNRIWNALSPDMCLNPYKLEYRWLTKVYDSVRPVDERGQMIWAALGSKTLDLIHDHISVESVEKNEEILEMDAKLIERFIAGNTSIEKKTRKLELDLAAIIREHSHDPRFVTLGEKMEKLREEHEAGLINSIEFLKALLAMAKDTAQMLKEVPPEEMDPSVRAKAALTQLFDNVRNRKTPVIVERIVADIDGIVRQVRFPGWQDTPTGRREVSKNLRDVIMTRYRIKDPDVFSRAYSYVEQYY